MMKFYRDATVRTVRPEIFSRETEELASRLAAEKANKRSQLRKFYDEVVRLNSLARNNPTDWENVLPFVHMLVAKAAYAEGRGLVTGEFVDFIKGSVDQVNNSVDLDVFANVFEAFMGFYRKHRPRDN